MGFRRGDFRPWLAVAVAVVWAAPANAEPQIRSLSLRGLTAGATTRLVIDGAELAPDPVLLCDAPLAGQQIVSATPQQVEVDISLSGDVPPGIYLLRVASQRGVSAATAIAIDTLPQQPLAAEIESLPVAFTAVLSGDNILSTRLSGKKGQRVAAEVEAARFGAVCQPVLRLLDERGVQVAFSPPHRLLAGDARIDVRLPADGAYTIELHDMLYRAPGGTPVRLKVGAFDYVDLTWPLGVEAGQAVDLAPLVGSLAPGEKLPFAAPSGSRGRLPLTPPPKSGRTWSGPPAAVFVSPFPEGVAAPAGDNQPQPLPAPGAVSGRLEKPGGEGRFHVDVQPGQKLRFEVWSHRLGSPMDGVLTVRGVGGQQPSSNDDQPGTVDPGLDYTVPGSVERLLVTLRDMQGRGGDDYHYRLAVTDIGQPAFELTLDLDRWNAPAGGVLAVPVRIARRGYEGPIELSVRGLGEQAQLGGLRVPAGRTQALVSLAVADDAAGAGLLSLEGRGEHEGQPVEALAELPAAGALAHFPWLRTQLAWSVAPAAPISLAWNGGADQAALGGEIEWPIRVARREGTAGQLRLKLLTTQPMPKKKIKENNQDKEVDDLDRALRLEGEPLLAESAGEAVAKLLVPGDLPPGDWDVVVVAELLSADGKNVVATASTPTRTLHVAAP